MSFHRPSPAITSAGVMGSAAMNLMTSSQAGSAYHVNSFKNTESSSWKR